VVTGGSRTARARSLPLQFTSKANRQIPQPVREALAMRFNNATVWCNLRHNENGSGQFRLDTINLAKGRTTSEVGRELHIKGNTYRLK
jgi:hypothetical protein